MKLLKSLDLTTVISLIVVAAYGSIFWLWQLSRFNEPAVLTAFYRHSDFGYFVNIARLLRYGVGEYMLPTSKFPGSFPIPVTSILPYSVCYALLGPWGMWLGDVLVHLLRFGCFIGVANLFVKKQSERALVALFLFFVSSELILGDFSSVGFVQGIWGIRIPRTIVTSSFLVLSMLSLQSLPEFLAVRVMPWRRLLLNAFPLVLLLNGDVYTAVSIGLVYLAAILFWYGRGEILARNTILYVIFGVLAAAPFVYYMMDANPDHLERSGKYPLLDRLLTIEVPSRTQLLLLVLSFLLLSILARARALDPKRFRFLTLATCAFGLSMIASLFFGVVNQAGIQEYHFAYARDALGGWMLILWATTLLCAIPEMRPRWGILNFLSKSLISLATLGAAAQVGSSAYAYGKKHAFMETEPDPGLDHRLHEGWRNATREVIDLVRGRVTVNRPYLIATMDAQLRVVLMMMPDVYSFLPDPAQSLASNREIEDRFYIFCRLLHVTEAGFASLLSLNDTHLGFFSGARYQFNRITTRTTLSDYAKDSLSAFYGYRDNWAIAVPTSERQRILESYRRVLALPDADPFLKQFGLPDLIIMPQFFGAFSAPTGFHLLKQDSIFIAFERDH